MFSFISTCTNKRDSRPPIYDTGITEIRSRSREMLGLAEKHAADGTEETGQINPPYPHQ